MKPNPSEADSPHTPEREAQDRDFDLRLRFSCSFVLSAVCAIAKYVAIAAAHMPFGRNFSVPCSGTYAGVVADNGAEPGSEARAEARFAVIAAGAGVVTGAEAVAATDAWRRRG